MLNRVYQKIHLLKYIFLFVQFLPNSTFSRDVLKISNEIRETTFNRTTIAASEKTLYQIDYNLSGEEIIKTCNTKALGLWCSGIAYVYYLKLKEVGIKSYILSVGFPGEFTHASVLVKTQNSYIIQDPYLNFMIEDDCFGMLNKLKKKIKPK